MSETTRTMVHRRNFLYDTFDWAEHGMIRLKSRGITLKTHTCEQIFAENESSDVYTDRHLDGMGQGLTGDANAMKRFGMPDSPVHRHDYFDD